jgi:cholest-4-en-3-one 26-monooxygenase
VGQPEIDFQSGAFYNDARETYRWMRTNAPVCRDERTGIWGVTTYDGVLAAERDDLTFSNAEGTRPDTGPMPWMLDLDGAAHSKRRKLVSGGFTPRRVRATAEHLGALCDELLDQVCERGECDVVADLAAPLPMIVIGDMLGVAPEDRGDLLRWSDDLLATLTGEPGRVEAAAVAFGEYDAYARRTIAARRSEPCDDLFSVLVQAEIDGDRLTDDELVFDSLLLLVGGDETTRHVISGGTEQIVRHPSERERLARDPELLPGAVEEMLRWVSPVKSMNRTVTREIELEGQTLAVGDKLLLLYEAANFDETHFADPDTFEIERSPNDHLAFGFGAHFCLGAALARLEVTTMIDRIVRRLPDLELATDDPIPQSLGVITSLPVAFTPTERVLA